MSDEVNSANSPTTNAGKPSYILPTDDQRTRYEQSIRVGCLEMERIAEEIIIPELNKIGACMLKNGLDVEIILFDSESPTEHTVYICGAGLRITNGKSTYALVFTGDPYRFEFNLQAHALNETKIDQQVEYHRLTPIWIYNIILTFFEDNLPNTIDTSDLQLENDEWNTLQGPFTIKMKGEDNKYNVIAEAEDLDEATRMGSMFCSTFHTQDKIVLFDNLDRKVC